MQGKLKPFAMPGLNMLHNTVHLISKFCSCYHINAVLQWVEFFLNVIACEVILCADIHSRHQDHQSPGKHEDEL